MQRKAHFSFITHTDRKNEAENTTYVFFLFLVK